MTKKRKGIIKQIEESYPEYKDLTEEMLEDIIEDLPPFPKMDSRVYIQYKGNIYYMDKEDFDKAAKFYMDLEKKYIERYGAI